MPFILAITTTITNQYVYDHMDRKVGTWEQLTYSPGITTSRTLISNVIYNELGRVMSKQLHSLDSATFLQNIAYNYNERGWLLGSSAPSGARMPGWPTEVGFS